MTIAVDRELMARPSYGAHAVGPAFDVLAHVKERGRDLLPGEHLQQLRRILPVWAVIKGQRD